MKNLIKIASLALVATATTVTAQNTFNLQYYFPTSTSAYDAPTSFAADGSTVADAQGVFDITGTPLTSTLGQFTFTFLESSSWNSAAFNGFTVDLTTGGSYLFVVKDAATTDSAFTGSEVSLTGPAEVSVNWQGEAFTAGQKVVLDYAITPEPGTLALAGLGFAGMVAARRRSSK